MQLSSYFLNRQRTAKAAMTAMALVALAACSGGTSNSLAPVANDPVIPVQNLVISDIENVQSSSLTAVDPVALDQNGLQNVFFNTQLNCPDGWQTTSFAFDASSNSVSGMLCDNTALTADYTVRDGVVVITDLQLDGQSVANDSYEYWGLLAEEGETERWRACYYRQDIDSEAPLAGQQPLPLEQLLAPVDSVVFDCSDDAYLFYDASTAGSFVAKQ